MKLSPILSKIFALSTATLAMAATDSSSFLRGGGGERNLATQSVAIVGGGQENQFSIRNDETVYLSFTGFDSVTVTQMYIFAYNDPALFINRFDYPDVSQNVAICTTRELVNIAAKEGVDIVSHLYQLRAVVHVKDANGVESSSWYNTDPAGFHLNFNGPSDRFPSISDVKGSGVTYDLSTDVAKMIYLEAKGSDYGSVEFRHGDNNGPVLRTDPISAYATWEGFGLLELWQEARNRGLNPLSTYTVRFIASAPFSGDAYLPQKFTITGASTPKYCCSSSSCNASLDSCGFFPVNTCGILSYQNYECPAP